MYNESLANKDDEIEVLRQQVSTSGSASTDREKRMQQQIATMEARIVQYQNSEEDLLIQLRSLQKQVTSGYCPYLSFMFIGIYCMEISRCTKN